MRPLGLPLKILLLGRSPHLEILLGDPTGFAKAACVSNLAQTQRELAADASLQLILIPVNSESALEDLRASARLRPVVACTPAQSPQLLAAAFAAGASEVLSPDMDPLEMRLRILKTALGASPARAPHSRVRRGPLELRPQDFDAFTIERGAERALGLTKLEFKILLGLAHASGPWAAEDIIRKLWGQVTTQKRRALELHLTHLRSKLPATAKIQLEPGRGYVLKTTSEQQRERQQTRTPKSCPPRIGA